MKNKNKNIVISMLFTSILISCISVIQPTKPLIISHPSQTTIIKKTITTTKIMLTSTLTPSATPKPTIMMSVTPTVIPTIHLPSPTFGPTFTLTERNSLIINLLEKNSDCLLPCFWDFTPGTTTWEEVSKFMYYMGDYPPFKAIFDNNSLYTVEYQDDGDLGINLGFYVNEELVDFIMSQIIVKNDSKLLNNFERVYSLSSFMMKYGQPSRIWLMLVTGEIEYPSSTYLMIWLFYDQKGYAIIYYDSAERAGENYQICPNKPLIEAKNPLQFELFMQDAKNPSPLENIYTLLGMKISDYKSIDEATGIDVTDFYNLIINGNDNACITTPRSIWP